MKNVDTNYCRKDSGVYPYIGNSIDSCQLNNAGFNLSKIEQVQALVKCGLEKYLIVFTDPVILLK